MFQYNHAVKLMEAGEYKEAIAAFEALAGYEDSSEMVNTARHKYKVEQLKVAAIGDSVFFGTYEQDNNKSNGGEKIEWLVLEASNGKILVISKYALASKSYHATFTDVTWESCTLRQWLNADFVDSAFSDTESAMLSGEDKVFLLTSDEAAKYFPTDAERVCQPTEYMLANGIHVNSQNGNCQFWLLHSGPAKQNAPAVLFNGMIYDTNSVLSEKAVRPAMWIDLSAAE
jgi:hypothetical protein